MWRKVKLLASISIIAIFALQLLFLVTAANTPEGPDEITTISSERHTEDTTAKVVQAQAGNVTYLDINDTQITTVWQGYYGNVTGTIVLDNANNDTFFQWFLGSPSGEIYAANNTIPDWSDVGCVNFTNNLTASETGLNAPRLDSVFNITANSSERFNRTFPNFYPNAVGFQVGNFEVINSADNCPYNYTFSNGNPQTTTFVEVLLTDNASIIFTTVLEQDATGFDGNTYDFQLMVAENGYNPTTTPYYFYVELN